MPVVRRHVAGRALSRPVSYGQLIPIVDCAPSRDAEKCPTKRERRCLEDVSAPGVRYERIVFRGLPSAVARRPHYVTSERRAVLASLHQDGRAAEEHVHAPTGGRAHGLAHLRAEQYLGRSVGVVGSRALVGPGTQLSGANFYGSRSTALDQANLQNADRRGANLKKDQPPLREPVRRTARRRSARRRRHDPHDHLSGRLSRPVHLVTLHSLMVVPAGVVEGLQSNRELTVPGKRYSMPASSQQLQHLVSSYSSFVQPQASRRRT